MIFTFKTLICLWCATHFAQLCDANGNAYPMEMQDTLCSVRCFEECNGLTLSGEIDSDSEYEVERFSPEEDLTGEGVEPNPGPPKRGNNKKKNSGLTTTKKTNIMKGVGSYSHVRGKTTHKVKGRGGFFEDAGSKVGQWLGGKAGGLLSKIFGTGVYSVTKNSLTSTANDPPQVTNTSGATRVQHREFIQDVSGSTAFVIQAFPINPGISQTFPWLSAVANSFEEYILHGILFEFKSTSATALDSTNTALGTVIMATEYNALHPNFTSKRDMENYVYSTSSPPAVSALHPVECARDVSVLNELYVRNVPPSLPTDLRFSDLGRFQIATVGMQAASVIGELWVTYDIELIKPKLPDAYTSVGPSHHVYSEFDVIPNPLQAAPTAANLFGVSGEKVKLLGVGLTAVTLSTNTLTFNTSGRYIVMMNITITTPGADTLPGYVLANSITGFTLFHRGTTPGATADYIAPDAGVLTSNNFWMAICIDVIAGLTDVPTLQYSGATFTSVITGLDLFVIPLPTGFQDRIVSDPLSFMQHQIEVMRREMDGIQTRSLRPTIRPLVCSEHKEHLEGEETRVSYTPRALYRRAQAYQNSPPDLGPGGYVTIKEERDCPRRMGA